MRLKRVFGAAIGAALISVVTTVPAPAPAGPTAPGDPTAASFAFAIGPGMLAGSPASTANRLGDFDLVVIDGEEASAGDVAALRAQGATVLAYLSVGTIEGWRGWFDRIKRYRLDSWQAWRDEWFADVSKPGLRRVIAAEVAPRILAKGFDGLFLDNVDMVEPARHRAQRDGMARLVRRISRLSDRREALLFAQNGLWGLRRLDLVGLLDGWNREDVTWGYDFVRDRYQRVHHSRTAAALRELEAMRDRGLITTTTDYTARSHGRPAATAIANACSVGARPYVSGISLSAKRLPNPPISCR